jgi:phospholipase/carboxylesterase
MRQAQIGGLNVRLTGGNDGHGGGNGPLVILLHGYGAPGDDLLALAEVLTGAAGMRWMFPEGFLRFDAGYGDAHAWWMVDMDRLEADRRAGRVRDLSSEIPPGLARARQALETFVTALPRVLPVNSRQTIIGGFSQGAMLTCDLVMRTAFPCAGLIQLSGTLLAKQDWRPSIGKRAGLPVFLSHGVQDQVLPYVMAERLRDELIKAGVNVQWHAFQGGHEIPQPIVARLNGFITKVLAKA